MIPLEGLAATQIGREIFYMVELELEGCGNVYGVAPCTAGGGSGAECYNCWATCQDAGNYTRIPKIFTFMNNQTALPIGYQAYPCIDSQPVITAPKMEIMQGIGERGAVEISMIDFEYTDIMEDPYHATRIEKAAGTFFGRFRARYPYYHERPFKLYVGYAHTPFDKENLSMRQYLIDNFSGPDNAGKIKIKGKDILKMLDDERRTCPRVSDVHTTEPLTAGETVIDIEQGEGYELPAANSYVEIGEEIIFYGTNTGTQLQNCDRGGWGTEPPETHELGAAIQLCFHADVENVVDLTERILTEYGDIPPEFIPTADWAYEKAQFLPGNNLTFLLPQPMGIKQIIAGFSEQNAFNIWWDETRSEIRLKAVSPAALNAAPPEFNDLAHFLADSIDIKDDDSLRITQLWVYFGLRDPTDSVSDPGNYLKLVVARDAAAEGPNEFNSQKIKIIYAQFLDATADAIVRTVVDRALVKTSRYTKKIKFKLDAKDITIWTGEDMIMRSRKIQQSNGHPLAQRLNVISAKETIMGSQFEFEAFGQPFYEADRYAFIMENDAPDYEDATPEEKLTGGFISVDEGDFPDGGKFYAII